MNSTQSIKLSKLFAFLFIFLPFSGAFAQTPTVSYSTPQTYAVGNAITALSPTSTGVASLSYGSLVYVGSNISSAGIIAADAAGNIYVIQSVTNGSVISRVVKKISTSNTVTTIMTGLQNVQYAGIAVDAAGNVYVNDTKATVKKIPAGGGTPVTIGDGFNGVTSIAVDARGDVYLTDIGNHAIEEIPANGGSPIVLVANINSNFFYIAVDAAGNIYISESGNVSKIPAGNGTPVYLSSRGAGPIALDGENNLYWFYGQNIQKLTAGTTTPVTFYPANSNLIGLAIGPNGTVYISDQGSSDLLQIKQTGGYYINGLPPGLNFSNTTGTISGTPTAASAATNYTVTAYNGSASATATINIKVNDKPAISYPSPQVYTQNSAITPVAPTSSNVAAPAYSNAPLTLSGYTFSSPNGVAFDKAGNMYVADTGNGQIEEFPAGGGAPVVISSYTGQVAGVAADAAGNIYVANNLSSVVKIPLNGGSQVSYGAGTPTAVAVDAKGYIYYTDAGNNVVSKVDPATLNVTTVAAGFNNPLGIALDSLGNIYVADSENNAVKKIALGTGTITTIGSGFNYPTGVAVDAAGNVFVADSKNNYVKEIPAGSNTPATVVSGLNNPYGVSIDAAGDLYVADKNNNAIKIVKPVGGYYISNLLPNGLKFSTSTGIISGTPLTPHTAQSYTVTAYNTVGGGNATINLQVRSAAPATVSYSSPQKYLVGTAISTLTPTTTGVAAPGFSSSVTALGSGLNAPFGVAVDGAGNVYVADTHNNAVKKIPANGGSPVIIGSGFNSPTGVAADAAGDVFVVDQGNNAVKKIAAGSNTPVTIGSGFIHPAALALDAAGDLFVSDLGNATVQKIAPGSNTPVTAASGFTQPYGVAVDAAGNIYVADAGVNEIVKIPASGASRVAIGYSPAGSPEGVAIDGAGNIYIAYTGNNTVKMIPAAGGTPLNIGSGIGAPSGVAVDGAGNVYVADVNATIKKIAPVGGYFINSLPVGLAFSTATGAISGTPKTASPATSYTVTAYNAGGPTATALNITINSFTFSYTNPPAYNVGVPVTPLTPTASGAAAQAYGTPVELASGIQGASSVAIDAAGNSYVTGTGNNEVYKISPAGVQTTIAVAAPHAIATDALGNVYITTTSGALYLVKAGTTTAYTGPVSAYFTGVTVSPTGIVYYIDGNNGLIIYYIGNNLKEAGPSSYGYANDIAFDKTGDFFLSGGNRILKVPVAGLPDTLYTPGKVATYGVSVDPSGNIYTNLSTGILEFLASGGTALLAANTTAGSQNNSAYYYQGNLAVDSVGNIFDINSAGSGAIPSRLEELKPMGGYFINPALPAGLVFNSNTGAISGTPTQVSAAKIYTITAYNSSGASSTTTVTLQVVTPLIALHLSAGTLSPVFAPNTTSYTASVANTVGTITVTVKTATNSTANITVNGTAVASGAASQAILLNPGANIIKVAVAAPNGLTTKTYSITVTRAGSNTATALATLHLSAGTLSPAFAAGITSYTESVTYAISSITVSAKTAAATSTIKVNGTAVASGTASQSIPLKPGANTVSVVVTAADGFTTQTYTVTVNRAATSIATLATLHLSAGTLSPAFASATTGYSESVAGAVSSVTVTAKPTDANATMKVNGTAVAYGTTSQSIPLFGGANTISIVVTAADGVTTQTYTVTVNRAASSNAALATLHFSAGTLSPAFASTTTSYTESVTSAVTSVTATAKTADATATITVNGATVTSGTASQSIPLNPGANTITIVVTAQDGITKQTYTTVITRAAGPATLATLHLSAGTLSPAFASATTGYSESVTGAVSSVTVTAKTTDANATMKVNGTAVTSGTASQSIALLGGANTISIVVTAADGLTTNTYTVTVNRAASSNAALATLHFSAGTLSPTFVAGTTNYTESVGNLVYSVTVTARTADATATMTVNGAAVASGTASQSIPLSLGTNTITIVVNAQDGTTKQTYTAVITRTQNDGVMLVNALSSMQSAETPVANDGIKVHQAVSPNGDGIDDFLQIENITQYPDNHLSIIDRSGKQVYNIKGYDGQSKVFDGHSNLNGQLLLPGTYFYLLDYTASGAHQHKTGFLVLKY